MIPKPRLPIPKYFGTGNRILFSKSLFGTAGTSRSYIYRRQRTPKVTKFSGILQKYYENPDTRAKRPDKRAGLFCCHGFVPNGLRDQ